MLAFAPGCGNQTPKAPTAAATKSAAKTSADTSQSSANANTGAPTGQPGGTAAPAAGPSQVALSDANPCTAKDTCGAADLDFSYTGSVSQAGHFLGKIGTDVAWSFSGLDHKSLPTGGTASTRHTVVFLLNMPAAAFITPSAQATALTNTVKVDWTASSVANGSFKVVVRDYERCKITETDGRCDSQSVLADYDKTYGPIVYEVTSDGLSSAGTATPSVPLPVLPTSPTPAPNTSSPSPAPAPAPAPIAQPTPTPSPDPQPSPAPAPDPTPAPAPTTTKPCPVLSLGSLLGNLFGLPTNCK